MLRYINLSFNILIYAFFAGCSGQSGSETEHEHEGSSVTLWTENTELFMEYPALIVGQEAVFAVHLSDMKDFKPVIQGELTCVFKNSAGEQVTAVADAPSYPGIFRPIVKFKQAGVYDLQLKLEGQQVSDVINVPGIRVYANAASVPHAAEGDTGEELIPI